MEPQEVAGKEFLVGMRGYLRDDVRTFLRAVAEELFRRDEVISALRYKLDKATRQLEEANGQRDVDRATLVKLVGEEASAILSSADGAAERIRFEAERYAESVREGLVSTTEHLAGLYENLGRLLAELQAMEQQGRSRPEASRSDVVLLGPGDDYPFGEAEIRLDSAPSVSSGRPAVREEPESGGDPVE